MKRKKLIFCLVLVVVAAGLVVPCWIVATRKPSLAIPAYTGKWAVSIGDDRVADMTSFPLSQIRSHIDRQLASLPDGGDGWCVATVREWYEVTVRADNALPWYERALGARSWSEHDESREFGPVYVLIYSPTSGYSLARVNSDDMQGQMALSWSGTGYKLTGKTGMEGKHALGFQKPIDFEAVKRELADFLVERTTSKHKELTGPAK